MSFSDLARRRGATLLEMMTAAAIGIVIVAAATALFNNLRLAAEVSDRKLITAADLQLGTTIMQRTLENAGYHLPAPGLAIAVHKNVPVGALTNGYGESDLQVVPRVPAGSVAYTTAQEGIVEGSDVLEVLRGTDQGSDVTATTVSVAGGEKRNISFNASVGSQVLTYIDNDTGPVLVFRNAKMTCMGAITQRLAGLNRFEVSMINTRFELDPAVPANCPGPNMEVFRLGQRTRFMVYQFPGETRPHLAMQVSDAQGAVAIPNFGTGSGLLRPVPQPTPIAESIEDLQVSAVMGRLNPSDPTAPALTDCAELVCACDDGDPGGAGTDCLLNQDPAASNAATLRGVRVELTSRGQLDNRDTPPPGDVTRGRLPASYDRVMGLPDGVTRMQFRLAVDAPNLNPALVAAGP